jgi:hypothetical protein
VLRRLLFGFCSWHTLLEQQWYLYIGRHENGNSEDDKFSQSHTVHEKTQTGDSTSRFSDNHMNTPGAEVATWEMLKTSQ